MEEQKQHRKHCTSAHCLNLFRLLFAALPTIVFGVFTIVFTLQQDASAKATRAQDQRQADEMNRRLIFKEYIDDMRELFLHENFEKNINKSLLHIRVQTLTVLKHLDPVRKHDVIIFLYENRLIRRDQPYTVQLHGADLSGMKFIKSSTEQCDLPHLYLPGINANNIIFRNCFLVEAVFDNAFMNDAIFDSCNLASASFFSANLTNAYLHNNQFFNANFSGTYLVQTSIKAGVFQKVNLTNVDLYRSDISHSLLYPMTIDGIEPNIILNTRFPNATISDIDTRNLILDGQAQTQCHLSVPTSWLDAHNAGHVRIINRTELAPETTTMIKDDCFFQIDKGAVAIQGVLIEHFSILIDIEQIVFNLSAMIGLETPNDQDEIIIFVHSADESSTFDYTQSVKKSIKPSSFFQFFSFIHAIPIKTRALVVAVSCNITSHKNRFCLFNQIDLSTVKKTV